MEDSSAPALSFDPTHVTDVEVNSEFNGDFAKGKRQGGSEQDLGLLLATTKLREGATMEELASESHIDRDGDLVIVEQDNQLRIRQSLASTLNDPTIDGDEDWWDYLESWVTTDGVVPTAVHPVSIPEVEVADFNPYLQRMSAYRSFFAENALELMAGDDEESDLGGEFDEAGNYIPKLSSAGSVNPEALRQVLSVVPSVYMKPPEAFFVEDTSVIDAAFSEEGTALLEELEKHEKMVEEQLLAQIGSKFNSFFTLLADFEGLQKEITEAIGCLGIIRGSMGSVGEPVRQGLQVSELMGQRRNLQLLHDKLELIDHLRQSQATMRSLVAGNNFSGATKLASESTKVLQEDLAGCRALQHMLHKVNKMSQVVHNKMQADFVDHAIRFSHEQSTRDTLFHLIVGLHRSEQLVSALGRYRTALQAETKRVVEETVGEMVKEAGLEMPRGNVQDHLSEMLCGLSHETCMRLLSGASSVLLQLLRRAVDLHSYLVETLVQESAEAAENESSSVLYDTCDEAHKQCARLLMGRSKLVGQLGLGDFHQVFELMLGFCVEGEKLLDAAWQKTSKGKTEPLQKCVSLRSTLLQQAKSFIESFHASKVQKLTAMLEQESWNQAEVPAHYQHLVDNFAQRNGTVSSASAPSKLLTVAGQHYRVPMSLLQLLKELTEYMHCADQLPALCTDILQRTIDILAHYNTRTCQLVLGAGAMNLAGLKSITARHLVLASQCLSVMLVCIPLIREYLSGYMSSRHEVLLVRFDAVAKDYLEHRSQIHSKIVSIFKERIDFHSKAAVSASSQEEQPRAWARNLLKDAATLYRVLIQYLPEEQLGPIFQQIAQLVNQHLVTHLSALDLSTLGMRRALAQDVAHLLNGSASAETDKQAILGLKDLKHFTNSLAGLEDFMTNLAVVIP